EMSTTIRRTLAKNSLGPTLLVSFIIVVMAGIFIAAIDPAINSPWDGIWWAWVTVTTVGYGDLVPQSPQGRIFGGLLMILGLGLFSLITATFSAFIIARDEEEFIEKEERILKRGDEIIEKEGVILEQEKSVVSEEGRILQQLSAMENRLEKLEAKLDRLTDRLSAQEDEEPPSQE
ncbi:MAG: potassium channel family protein, partial [Limisphaerales bacterium]